MKRAKFKSFNKKSLTPFIDFPSEPKVHIINNGYHISGKGGKFKMIRTKTGKVIRDFGKIKKSSSLKNFSFGVPQTSDFIHLAPPLTIPRTGRIVFSKWENQTGDSIAFFKTTWIVPPEPQTKGNQVIYLFNGLETSANDFILQPILFWGPSLAGGGQFWSIANMYAGGIETFRSKSVSVIPGQKLTGIIKLINRTGNQFSYVSSFEGFPNLNLPVTNVEELTDAFEALECKRLSAFSDYPDTVSTPMTNIELKLCKSNINDQFQAPLHWTPFNIVQDNGQHCLITVDGTPNGRVDIFYRQVAL